MTVYFIGGEFGAVKIGFTSAPDPSGRLQDLQVGCPLALEVLAHCPGEQSLEKDLHREFDAARMTGEWFRITKRLAALIGFAQKFGSLDSWREALDQPARFRDYAAAFRTNKGFAQLDGLPRHEVRWGTTGGVREYKPQRPQPSWARVFRAWAEVVELPSAPTHLLSERFWGPGARWARRRDGRGVMFNHERGANATAAFLAEREGNPEQVAATWILACIKDFVQRDQHQEKAELDNRAPDWEELVQLCKPIALSPEWGPMMTSVLPLPFVLPDLCSLSMLEFARQCALLYSATFFEYVLTVEWPEGASIELKQRRRSAA